MREQFIGSISDNLHMQMHNAAEQAIAMCAQELLSADDVAQRMWHDWTMLYREAEPPPHRVLVGLALRICSYELCLAWRSTQVQRYELAYANLLRYLRACLIHLPSGAQLQAYAYAIDDVVDMTLEEIHKALLKEHGGPDDPAAFLKWTQTILIRRASSSLLRYQRDDCVSLDAQLELFSEIVVDTEKLDPLKLVLLQELRQVLGQSIMELSNEHYRQVLLYGYFAEMEPQEIAEQLQVRVQDIYVWRSRALDALRKKPEVMRTLRSLL